MLVKDCTKQAIKQQVYDAIEKMKMLQKDLNAVVTFVEVEDQLQALEHRSKDGKLYGVPVVLKDNINWKNEVTSASSCILSNYISVYDATVSEKLKEAGAIVIAKASMDELGMGGTNLSAFTGKVNNPYDTSRISGGSSGGSAVLTAADCTPIALGTDTGDSIRKPAAYNGVIGLKPTYGRISRYGVIPYASSLDHVGFFTTCVEDAALTLEVLAGRDDKDMTSSYEEVPSYTSQLNSNIEGKTIAIFDNVQKHLKDERIKENFNELIKKLERRGAKIKHISIDETLLEAILPTYFIIANAEATANHSNLDGIRFGKREDGTSVEEVMMNTRTKGFSPSIRNRFVVGSYSLFTENQEKLLKKAQKVRRLLVNEVRKVLEECDVMIASAAGTIAPHPEHLEVEKLSKSYLISENHMILHNFSGYPSMTLPSGFVDQLPIGVNISAKPFQEQMLFNIGKAIEEETGLKGIVAEVKS